MRKIPINLVKSYSTLSYKLIENNLPSTASSKNWEEMFQIDTQKVASGVSHALFLSKDNQIFVKGSNYFGQAGFFPALSGGIFESGDDHFETPLMLEEGIKDIEFIDIVCGDFHNLALSKDNSVYCWGASLLGNKTKLFSSEPIRLPLSNHEKTKQISASRSRSAILTLSGNIYVWGFERDSNDTIIGQNLSPSPFSSQIIYQPSTISLTDHLIAIGNSKKIAICGTLSDVIDLDFPYNPSYADFKDSVYPINSKLLYELDSKKVIDFQLSGNHLYILESDGSVHVINLKSQLSQKITINEPIKKMSIGRTAAAFLSKETNAIFCFSSKLNEKKQVPFLSLAFDFWTKEKKNIIPGIPLHEAVLHGIPYKKEFSEPILSSCVGYTSVFIIK
jgi:alpha-tubulin suppressor-like RCC1 family protein